MYQTELEVSLSPHMTFKENFCAVWPSDLLSHQPSRILKGRCTFDRGDPTVASHTALCSPFFSWQ